MEVGALVMSTARLDEVIRFYTALGFPLAEEDHGDGIVHWACDTGALHVAVFAADHPGDAPSYHEAGSTLCGFATSDVQGTLEAMRATGCRVQQELTEMPWGLRAVVIDPDGRPVEIFQRAESR